MSYSSKVQTKETDKKYVMSITILTLAVKEKTAFIAYHHSNYAAFQAYWGIQSKETNELVL